MAAEPALPTSERTPAAPSPLPGAITLARHGEPALSRRVKLDAAGYRRWWATYEAGGILEGQTPPPPLAALARDARVVFASCRPRALQTVRALVGDRPVEGDALFVEAPLPPPPLPPLVRMSPRAWGVVSRAAWWWLGACPPDQENRASAEARARQACDRLVLAAETQGDVLLVAHGFFNAMIGRELKRRGWRKCDDGGYGYWSVQRFRKR